MGYSLIIPKKYFYHVKDICSNYKSYRECVIKKVEERYGVSCNNLHKFYIMSNMNNNIPSSISIVLFNDEIDLLKKIAEEKKTSIRKLILSSLGIDSSS